MDMFNRYFGRKLKPSKIDGKYGTLNGVVSERSILTDVLLYGIRVGGPLGGLTFLALM